MAEFITKCPHCNNDLQVQDEWIGMEVECPLCHKMFAINKSSAQVETEKTEAVINSALAADEKKCPFCNGIIKEQAIFCKHCKTDLNKTTTSQTQVESLFIFICPECDTAMELPESMKDKEYECPCCCESSIAQETIERSCPLCGEKVKIKATVCKHCKQKIKPIDTVNIPAESQQQMPSENFIFICPECNTVAELSESMKDKEYECPCCCESSIAQETLERDCPQCGEKVKIKATICKHCKQKISPLREDTVSVSQLSGIKELATLTPIDNNNNQGKRSSIFKYTDTSSLIVSILWGLSTIAWIISIVCIFINGIAWLIFFLIGLGLSALALAFKKDKKFELQNNEVIISTCRLKSVDMLSYYVRMTNQRLVLSAIEYPLLPLFITYMIEGFAKPKRITYAWNWNDIKSITMISQKKWLFTASCIVIEDSKEKKVFSASKKLADFWNYRQWKQ